jgi:energy-coupling factor transporter transmembrane protein EcfT
MSFMPLMSREASRLRTAQAVRCGFRRGFGVIGEVLPLLVPLIVGVFRRADELERSMMARYFELGVRRPPSDRAGRLDTAVCLIGLVLFIVGLYAKFQADH